MIADGALDRDQEKDDSDRKDVLWNIGELEFEAYMRMLDSAVSRCCLLQVSI